MTLASALERSVVFRRLRVAVATSRVRRALAFPTAGVDVGSWTGSSRLARLVDALETSSETSTAAGLLSVADRWLRGSGLYRWCRTDPEADVIVVDLRDTVSVGPVVRTFDRLSAVFPPSAAGGAVHGAGEFVRRRPLWLPSLALLSASIAFAVASGLEGWSIAAFGGMVALALLGLWSDRSLASLREHRAVRYLAAAFEPPSDHSDRT